MKKSKFSEQQVLGIFKEVEGGKFWKLRYGLDWPFAPLPEPGQRQNPDIMSGTKNGGRSQ